jgi:pyruvate dehydrogenase E1 component alpha subunit
MTSADLYRTVRLIRRFEERAIEFVRSGEIVGGIHPYLGEEGIAAGVCAALTADDVITSTHRGHGHVLARGVNPARLFAELMGRESGLNKGRGGSMHAADVSLGILGANAIVGAAGSIATGAAWALRRQGRDSVAVTFFGDGAMNEGMLLEAFNLAALWRVPVIFVCENNGYATTMPVESGGAGSITARARAFGMPAFTIDGQDPERVLAATESAVSRARAGRGPTFLECMTYRFDAHHTFEHRARLSYRTAAGIAAGKSRDPVELQAARVSVADRDRIDAEIESVLDAAAGIALGSAHPDPADALKYLYASAEVTG